MLLIRVYGPRRCGCVELVRVDEHRRLGRARRADVVVPGHGVQELGERGRVERARALLDHPEAEMDVAEEATFGSGLEERAPVQLPASPDVVKECGREQQVTAEPAMELGGVAAERPHGYRVLQQPARIAVMALRRCRQGPEAPPEL